MAARPPPNVRNIDLSINYKVSQLCDRPEVFNVESLFQRLFLDLQGRIIYA